MGQQGAERDWVGWHRAYDDPASSMARRLGRVQARVVEALDSRPPGPIRLLSMCAGQGRDLLGPLAEHPRRDDVRALLVELDPGNVALGAARARQAGLAEVRVVTGDAGITTAYRDIVPVDIALVCGVFGNIPDEQIRHTIEHLPTLLADGAIVIWTRHRERPDLTPLVRSWFERNGFTELGFDTEDGYLYAVGVHALRVPPRSYRPDITLFAFAGDGRRAHL